MIFDGKQTSEITTDEIRQLVTDNVAEDQFLDYKSESYPSGDRGTYELLKDITAFANADGGYLVIGVEENGQRRAIGFRSISQIEGIRRSIIDRCLAGIEPRIVNIDINTFQIDGNNILMLHIPESSQKPHCAKPNSEHHYFWRRYQDGNKLMSPAEIRECFQGDRVERELNDIRRTLANIHRESIIEREANQDVNQDNIFRLQSDDRFLQHQEEQFMGTIAGNAYYRLMATPIPINQIDLRDRKDVILQLVRKPPTIRPTGWDVTPLQELRQTAIGVSTPPTDFHHLELLWNGHLEFRTFADDESFHWDQVCQKEQTLNDLYPYAIIESAVNFVLLANGLYRICNYGGTVEFRLGLYNIRGKVLVPYAPESFAYMRERHYAQRPQDSHPFPDDHLKVGPISVQADQLPGIVAWQLIREIYYRFGHSDRHIPFFDEQHHCTLGNRKQQSNGSGQ